MSILKSLKQNSCFNLLPFLARVPLYQANYAEVILMTLSVTRLYIKCNVVSK